MRFDPTGLFFSLVFLASFLFLNRRFHSFFLPHYHFSSLKAFGEGSPSFSYLTLPRKLQIGAFLFFLLALSRPQVLTEEKEAPQEAKEEKKDQPLVEVPSKGLALYLLLDRSGSMRENVDVASKGRARRQITRLELLKEISKAFISGDKKGEFQGRKQDLVGLVAFARTAQILSPLTFDHERVLEEIEAIKPATSQQEGGTALGYALFKTVKLIASTRHFNTLGKELPSFEFEGEVIIMVTDGFNVPNPLDKGHPYRNLGLGEAADLAKKEGVRLYLVNIEPAILRPQYRPYLSLFEETAQKTGGKFFVMQSSSQLPEIFAEIEKLEEKLLPVKRKAKAIEGKGEGNYADLFPQLLTLGVVLFLLGSFLELTFLRRIP